MKEGFRSKRRVVEVALAFAMVASGSQLARAQSMKPASGGTKNRASSQAAPRRPGSMADASAPAPGATETALSGTAQALGAAVAGDAGVVESRTLDGGMHVFKFSELDIEGRLKSPQLVYFLRRVRAEFSAGDLGHRSFLHEMSETRKEPAF